MNNGGNLISRIDRISKRIFNKMLNENNIDAFNGEQGAIIYALWENKELTIKEISLITGLAKTTLTSMLDRMEKTNLICKTINTADKRSTKIKLTDSVKEYKNDFISLSNKMNNIFYNNFSTEEVKKFEKYLKRILDNIEERN